jgi:hypothetical protein
LSDDAADATGTTPIVTAAHFTAVDITDVVAADFPANITILIVIATVAGVTAAMLMLLLPVAIAFLLHVLLLPLLLLLLRC